MSLQKRPFLLLIILLNDRFCLYALPFLKHQFLAIFKRLFLLLPSGLEVYQNRVTEQLLTHSSVPKEHPIGCFFSACANQ